MKEVRAKNKIERWVKKQKKEAKEKWLKSRGDMWIWECEVCGRKGLHKFYEHATSKISGNDFCEGRVRRIKFKNAW